MKMMNSNSKELPIIIKDTREKTGYNFRRSPTCAGMEVSKLDTGDYSIKGMEHIVCVERKSISDLYLSLGKNKERFMREVDRMQEIPYRFIVIDGTLDETMKGNRFSKLTSKYISSFLFKLQLIYGIHVLFLGKGEKGREFVRELLIKAHRLYEEGALGTS